MKKYLVLYSLVVTVVAVWGGKFLFEELSRVKGNNSALIGEVERFRTKANQAAASVQVLRLKVGEYEEIMAEDAEKIRRMGIKIRRLESASKNATSMQVEVAAPLRDTVVVRDSMRMDSLHIFRWSDHWTSVEGLIARDSVVCRVHSVDTLHQVVHRIPRKFLFFRFGTKALRQQIVSSNPHTTVVYSEYILF